MFLVILQTRYVMNLRLCFDVILSGFLGIQDEISLEKELLWKVKRGKKTI